MPATTHWWMTHALVAWALTSGCSDGATTGGNAPASTGGASGTAALSGGGGLWQTGGGNGAAPVSGTAAAGGASHAGAASTGGAMASGGTHAGGSAGAPSQPACPGDPANAYQASPGVVPGTIQAEDFDPAGYSDATAGNEGGAYRADVDVDIKVLGAGYAVGWMIAGEWLEYTIDVATEGDYALTLTTGAVDPGRTLELSQCGVAMTDPAPVPQIADWGALSTVTVGPVHLAPGVQVIRVTVGASDYVDVDAISFELAQTGTDGGAGGTGSGGSSGVGGSGGSGGIPACDLPTSLSWTSSQPVITPKSPPGHDFVSLKDPTIVSYGGAYHVFATVFDAAQGNPGTWSSVYLTFTDFAQADAAPQIYMGDLPTGGAVAPQVFYFRPHGKWYLIYQWGAKYSTNDDIANPQGWSAPTSLLTGGPSNGIDYWVICDDAHCHLFFSGDDGNLYRSKTPIGSFPSFSGYEIVMSDTQGNLFEASNVYKVAGTDEYLLLVEAYGPRYFRSWTAPSLDGPWAALAATQQNPFAGAANVTFDGADWSDDVSHGEMIRAGYDETLTISGCNMQYLYQGVDPTASVSDYGLLPYRLGLLTQM